MKGEGKMIFKLKERKGVTLIALVITIITLLILAGISIGMLSGDNGLIRQTEHAKTQTDIGEEKEILEQATVVAMGKSKYGNVEKEKLEITLDNIAKNKTNVTNVGSKIYVEFIESSRFYKIDSDGNVIDLGENYIIPIPITANIPIINSS